MSFNISETFELLFDRNNNVAYKALQKLEMEEFRKAQVDIEKKTENMMLQKMFQVI